MPSFAVYKQSSGEVISRGTMATVDFCLAQSGPGESVYVGEVPADHFVYAGYMVPIPEKPSDAHLFDWNTHHWYDPRSIDELREHIKAQITEMRWQVETGGVTLPNGIKVKSAKDDQDRITAVLVNMQVSGMTSVDFKAASGWVTLTYEQVGGIAQAVALHVQSCFSMERLHHEAVDALVGRDDLLAYDFLVGWGG